MYGSNIVLNLVVFQFQMKTLGLLADCKAAEDYQPALITHNEIILKLHS